MVNNKRQREEEKGGSREGEKGGGGGFHWQISAWRAADSTWHWVDTYELFTVAAGG